MQELTSGQQAGNQQEDGLSDRVEGSDAVFSDISTFDSNVAAATSHLAHVVEEDGSLDRNTSSPPEQLSALADAADVNGK